MEEHVNVKPDEVREDYDLLMSGYTRPLLDGFSTEWRLIGDFYEQYSLYDHSLQSMSSNNLSLQ